MFYDVVVPNGNEDQLIRMAERLGFSGLDLLVKEKPKSTKTKQQNTKIKLNYIPAGNNKRFNSDVYLKARENNRAYFESRFVRTIYGLEFSDRKDFIHHRKSGLNQVLCALAKKNEIAIGFATGLLFSGDCAVPLGRMMQNASLCRKYKLKIILGSFSSDPYLMRSPKDLISFGSILGFHPSESKRALNR